MHLSAKLTNGLMVFDRYRLKRLLGRGGMGIVWLAHDTELEKDIALKFLSEHLLYDTTAIRDLKKETRRGMELSHPNIIRVYGFFSADNCAAVAMEYVEGNNLSSLRDTRTGGFFEVNEIASWTLELCSALHYAHSQAEIVHRDLKPANLMVDHKSRLKIADFGISASLTDANTRLTGVSSVVGTMLYMCPQQLLGQRPCITHDIYSLGATLFDLLTGKPVFHSGDVSLQIRESVPPTIEERREVLGLQGEPVPQAWEETIQACLDKDATKRPRTAAEVISRLCLQDSDFSGQLSSFPFSTLVTDAAPTSEPTIYEPSVSKSDRVYLSNISEPTVRDTTPAATGPVAVLNSGPIEKPRQSRNSFTGLMMALLILCSVAGGGAVAYFAFLHGSHNATMTANSKPLVSSNTTQASKTTTGEDFQAPPFSDSFANSQRPLRMDQRSPGLRKPGPGESGHIAPRHSLQSEGLANRAPAELAPRPEIGQDFSLKRSHLIFRWAPPFTFSIGAPGPDRNHAELPTEVTFTQGYWLSQHEVTQVAYQQFMGNNPSSNRSPQNPVENVTWFEAMEFCARLTAQYENVLPAGYEFSLPTQAQFEFASLGAVHGFYGGNGVHNYSWSTLNDARTTQEVGQMLPNEFLIYDTVGNVAEWCLDWYAPFPGGAEMDFRGPATGELKVVKGGSYMSGEEDLRAFSRQAADPNTKSSAIGFRVALTPIIEQSPSEQ